MNSQQPARPLQLDIVAESPLTPHEAMQRLQTFLSGDKTTQSAPSTATHQLSQLAQALSVQTNYDQAPSSA
ncbi:hypothetical protein H4R34_000876 [Dimargaris verticillata]|uniref:Uncharacterized protein n=1 Tax=Dimargaris verticillata TaxID=2761393 RepID=A0A9W8B5T2_9FUNG|nr:hypothetical protein H4R34_000876 [Dimargaris verticillata]